MINGKPIGQPTPVEPPDQWCARQVYEQDFAEGDTPWDELSDEDRAALIDLAHSTLRAHVTYLANIGAKIIPAGATAVPKSDDEAYGMLNAAKAWFDAQKRKGKLMNQPARKLIVPGKAH